MFIELWGQVRVWPVVFLCSLTRIAMLGQMFSAAERDDVKQLEQCINSGAKVDEQDSDGQTTLIRAAARRRKAAVDFLIAHKANVNHADRFGRFALYCAAVNDYEDICVPLLDAGADVNMECAGKTATQWAEEKGYKGLAAFLDRRQVGSVFCVINCSKLLCAAGQAASKRRCRKGPAAATAEEGHQPQ